MIPESWAGDTVIIGPADPTRPDLRACQYAVIPSIEFPGRPRVLARIELDDNDRALIALGCVLWLDLDGGELPWQLHITAADAEVPA